MAFSSVSSFLPTPLWCPPEAGLHNHFPFQLPIPTPTFLSLAAPVPERMASIKACLASTVLLRVPVLNLETVTEAEGGWEGAEGGGGRTGGGGGPWSSC